MHPPPTLTELATLTELVDQHAQFLYRVAFNLLRHPQDAEDAVQETLLKFLRTSPQWSEVQDPRAFLAAAVWRVGLNRLSSSHAKSMRHAQSIDALPEIGLPDPTPNPEQLAAGHEAHTLMCTLIEALPDTLRQPLLLAAIDGMRSREVAAILGIPEATVRTRIHRAKAHLREAFQAATTPRTITTEVRA